MTDCEIAWPDDFACIVYGIGASGSGRDDWPMQDNPKLVNANGPKVISSVSS